MTPTDPLRTSLTAAQKSRQALPAQTTIPMNELHIEKEILINATPEAVFDALTMPENIVEYFPLEKVMSSWTVGGELRMQGTADGQRFTDAGVIQSLVRPKLFEYTYWSDNHGTENRPENQVCVRYSLRNDAQGTRVTLVQSNLPSLDYRALMNEVWDSLLQSLQAYVESRDPVAGAP